MFDRELILFQMQNDYLVRLVSDISEEELRRQPYPGMNTAYWILGHLAIANDYTLGLLGGEKNCPDQWWAAFDYATLPADAARCGATKDQLLATLRAGMKDIRAQLAAGVDASRLAADNEFDLLRRALPTVGDFVAHLLTTHIAGHLGQLSAWRRAVGKPAVM